MCMMNDAQMHAAASWQAKSRVQGFQKLGDVVRIIVRQAEAARDRWEPREVSSESVPTRQ